MPTMTRTSESTAQRPSLLLAFELGRRTWKLANTASDRRRQSFTLCAAR